MSNKVIVKEYQPSIGQYAGNPFIEALPPILDTPDIICSGQAAQDTFI